MPSNIAASARRPYAADQTNHASGAFTNHHLLTNPIYGAAYAFGRTESRMTVDNGRKRVVRGDRRDRADWDVLIIEHHEGYITWTEFERNQAVIADNANSRGLMVRGSGAMAENG